MARCWQEQYDPKLHPDYMSSSWIGGLKTTREATPFLPQLSRVGVKIPSPQPLSRDAGEGL